MARSHRPRVQRRPSWQPVPLHLPLDRPARDPDPPARKNRTPTNSEVDDDPRPSDDDDTTGSHVIVIDLA